MPPITHILRFWTSSTTLTVKPRDEQTTRDSSFGYAWEQESGIIVNPATGIIFRSIALSPEWLQEHAGPAEFIVISPSVELFGECPRSLHDIGVNILLIEWRGSLAYRVHMFDRTVPLAAWRKTNPVWKLINLA